MRSLVYIDTHDLSFATQADNSHKADLDVAAITFGDNGLAIDKVARTYELRLKEEDYQRVIKHGLIYSLNVPVKKAGAYQLRVAVRDAATERVGSAGQFVEVPDLNKNRLALSGIILGGMNRAAAQKRAASEATGVSPAPASQSASASGDAAEIYDPQAGPAVRRLSHDMLLDFGYVIYNAQLDRAGGRPQLTTQVRLFRDGQQVFAGKELPFSADKQTDLKRLVASGRLQLGTNLPPGEYELNGYASFNDYQAVRKPITVPAGRPEFDLGRIDLPATPISRNYGKPAPPWHVTAARGVSKRVRLADFRGRWLLVEFWGFW